MNEEEIEERWQANVQAVQDAKKAQLEALRGWARVREDAHRTARRRDPRYPVLNAGEQARVDGARETLDLARKAVEEAKIRFKAGEGVPG